MNYQGCDFIIYTFETLRTIIRPYEKRDADAVWKIVSHPKIYETTYFIPKDYPREKVDWWINSVNNSAKAFESFEFGIFNKENGAYIGNCGITGIKKREMSGSIAYFIDPGNWNNGYATESGEAMLEFAFEVLRLYRVSGKCMSQNAASSKVMEKLGFTYEGTGRKSIYKDGKFLDVHHFSILLNEYLGKYKLK